MNVESMTERGLSVKESHDIKKINQSINQSINQTINQSINQINQ